MADPNVPSRSSPAGEASRSSDTVQIDRIIANLTDLEKRIETLEKIPVDEGKEQLTLKSKSDSQSDINSGWADKEVQTDEKQDESEVEGGEATKSDLLSDYVEFRREIYVEEKLSTVWVSDTVAEPDEEKTSRERQFRYDTHENGEMSFSVSRSAALYKTLLEICQPAYDTQIRVTRNALEIDGEFALLHCRQKLKEMEEDPMTDDATRIELQVMEMLYERKGHLLDAKQRYDELLDDGKIDFKSLKGLFYKDQLVTFRELRDEWAIARVKTIETGRRLDDEFDLHLECEAIDFDGESSRHHLYRKYIKWFSGTKNITELSLYPLSFHREKDELIGVSIESGERWERLHRQLVTNDGRPRSMIMQYSGYCEAWEDDVDSDDEYNVYGREISSRVIVDPTQYANRQLKFTRDNTEPLGQEEFKGKPEDNPLVLCPEKVLVYSLSDNQQYYVAMRKLRFPTWISDAWDRLIQPGPKHTSDSIDRIRRLAKAHATTNQKQQDDSPHNFRGKGKGLTFLLYGPPGVGKTMLAECLSEECQMPLYRINLGMLVAEDEWESKIEEIFQKAHFWGAILLIDEAEVVLSERTQESMQSLAWVAVFLRKIEYFEGILFLTTNQIHMVDPAFVSRVNLGMEFPELDSATRLQIWKQMLKELGSSSGADWLLGEEQALRNWASKPLNGRQIRNVIYSARLLADPPMIGPLTKKGIEECLQDVINFMTMIKEKKKMVEMNFMSHWN